jgi:Ca2+-binding EF-hand superfamily protein
VLKTINLFFGAILVVLTMDCVFAEKDKGAVEPGEMATECQKKPVVMTPPPVNSKGMAVEDDPLDKRFDALLHRIDADKDGRISHDEYMMPDEVFFKNSDSNHDGFLTKEELKNAWKKRMRSKKYRMMQEQLKEKQPSQ